MADDNPVRKVEGALESNTTYYITVGVMVLVIIGIVGWWVTQ
jgi:hypothetical protein